MKFITVYRAFNETEAGMVRDFLIDQGIQSTISSQFPEAVYGSAVQEIQVQADAEQEALARELIAAYFSDEAHPSEAADEAPSEDSPPL